MYVYKIWVILMATVLAEVFTGVHTNVKTVEMTVMAQQVLAVSSWYV
jgi:hypothetical protein